MAALAHYGFGFAVKRIVPKMPVGFLVLACGVLDLLYFGFSLLGIEPVQGVPVWTHSLVMAFAWSLAAAGLTALLSRSFRSSLALGLLVFSHWAVDAVTWPMSALDHTITNRIPIFIQAEPNIGLGLYRTVFGAVLGEGVFFLAGVALYIIWLVKYKKEKKARTDAAVP